MGETQGSGGAEWFAPGALWSRWPNKDKNPASCLPVQHSCTHRGPWVPWVTREETWEGLNTQFLLPTTCLLAVLWGRQALLDQGLSPSTRGGGAASSSSFHKAQTRGGSNKAVHPFLVAL